MKKKYWLDERRNVMLLIKIFAGLCVGVLAIDAGFHRHEEFFWEGWFGFYGFFGFIACVAARARREGAAPPRDAARGLL